MPAAQTVTAQQIAQYAYNAGFRGLDLIRAIAVALAESGGNIFSYNPETAAGTPNGSGSRGLWQIYGKAHPEYNNDTVYDPQANANAAYAVYKAAGNSFTPWTTYKTGAYTAYTSVAQSATNTIKGITEGFNPPYIPPVTAPIVPPVVGAITGAGDLISALQPLWDWLRNPGRVVKLIVGIGLAFVAILLLTKPEAEKAAKTVAQNPELLVGA